ncbi:hypothetical protein B7P43_G00967 [Cryptotermes secundus]|uniref:NEDD4 family-interacting protein 1-like n=1 Tax=Cryptotermes secundus TaxID=105785 RepID=A0A2J7PGE2_9NEOP|nr:hypothetical protein B7P43_G00967 [Cryptotermes secundus]
MLAGEADSLREMWRPTAPTDQRPPISAVSLTVTLPATALPQTEMTTVGLPSSIRGQDQADEEDIPPPKPDFSAPPPYEVATKLPTYEEVQREKTLEGEHTSSPRVPLAFLAIDTESPDGDSDSGLLGTDFMFFTAFLVAFLFNWIGFLLLMCFCHTVAARYGALSGFGLSLAKWTLIVKHSTDLASRENSWLWWLIMAFGNVESLTYFDTVYINVKREPG